MRLAVAVQAQPAYTHNITNSDIRVYLYLIIAKYLAIY